MYRRTFLAVLGLSSLASYQLTKTTQPPGGRATVDGTTAQNESPQYGGFNYGGN